MHQIHNGFKLKENKSVTYLSIPSFEEAGGVICAFSTRIGGVSPAPFDTLNFSKKREQSPENFMENLKRFSVAVGFDYRDTVAINYAHSALLYNAKKEDAGCGIIKESVPDICDGLFTSEDNLPIMSMHADCAPLFFYDPKRRNIAVCHAGWRGVASHMVKNAINSLVSLGSDVNDILSAVGPCIGFRSYEVGQDVYDIFLTEFGEDTVENRTGRMYADLSGACVADMINSGISPENITTAGLCTYEQEDLFFSHRRDKGQTGAMASVIVLTDK